MFFAEVTKLHGPDGERLKRGRREPPMRGTLVISGRGLRHLQDARPGDHVRSHPPAQPKGEGLLMAGYRRETDMKEGKTTIKEHRQVWVCVPTFP